MERRCELLPKLKFPGREIKANARECARLIRTKFKTGRSKSGEVDATCAAP